MTFKVDRTGEVWQRLDGTETVVIAEPSVASLFGPKHGLNGPPELCREHHARRFDDGGGTIILLETLSMPLDHEYWGWRRIT